MDIPPVYVESVTKDRHLNPALIYWCTTLLLWVVFGSTVNYLFQQLILRKIHKRLFRRFGASHGIPPPPAEDLTASVTPDKRPAPLVPSSSELPPPSSK